MPRFHLDPVDCEFKIEKKMKLSYRQEDKDVAIWKNGMKLKYSRNSSAEIVGFGLGSIMNLDREFTTRDWTDNEQRKPLLNKPYHGTEEHRQNIRKTCRHRLWH